MTQAPPHKVIVKMMMKTFVLCVVTNAPLQFVGTTMRSTALDVLTLTLVGCGDCACCNIILQPFFTSVTFPCYNTPYVISLEHNPRQGFGCRIRMYASFLVCPYLCYVVSFVLRVPGLEEGVMFSGKAFG